MAVSESRQRQMHTPWGFAQTRTAVGEQGIVSVSTPGHGGYYVPDDLLPYIPQHHRQWAAKWSGSENWYEEDCCWAAVCLAFPELFPVEALPVAQSIVEHYAK